MFRGLAQVLRGQTLTFPKGINEGFFFEEPWIRIQLHNPILMAKRIDPDIEAKKLANRFFELNFG